MLKSTYKLFKCQNIHGQVFLIIPMASSYELDFLKQDDNTSLEQIGDVVYKIIYIIFFKVQVFEVQYRIFIQMFH